MKYCPTCKTEYSDDQAICLRDAATLVEKSPQERNEQPSDPLIGRTIAEKYCIERLIGRGGMGAVYEGRHLLLDRPIAVKVLHQNMSADSRAAARFIREAKASAKIEHPNAVTIHDFGVLQDGSAYLVMEFIRGHSLRQILTQQGKIELEQSIDWIAQVCSVVELAHQQGIIHRDLKPENVMLKESPDGSVLVKVVDFGLAKLVSSDGEPAASLTQTGEVLGTPHYMAPEFYEGEQADKRADIYAIGVILYEMLTGVTPFSGTVQSIIGGHLFKDPKPLFEADPSIHPQINEVVQLALKKKREERIGSAAEFAQQLKAAMKAARKASGALPAEIPAKPGIKSAAASPPAIPPGAGSDLQKQAALSASTAGAKPSKPLSESKQLEKDQRVQTGDIPPGGNTDMLGEGEAKRSAELKRDTGAVTYDTVAMSTKGASPTGMVEHLQSRSKEPIDSQMAMAGQDAPNWQVNMVYATQPLGSQLESEQGEPETFLEMVVSMKRELAIGSIIVTLLAIALVAFIIYNSQQSKIRVKPLPDAPAQTQGSMPPTSNPNK